MFIYVQRYFLVSRECLLGHDGVKFLRANLPILVGVCSLDHFQQLRICQQSRRSDEGRFGCKFWWAKEVHDRYETASARAGDRVVDPRPFHMCSHDFRRCVATIVCPLRLMILRPSTTSALTREKKHCLYQTVQPIAAHIGRGGKGEKYADLTVRLARWTLSNVRVLIERWDFGCTSSNNKTVDVERGMNRVLESLKSFEQMKMSHDSSPPSQ